MSQCRCCKNCCHCLIFPPNTVLMLRKKGVQTNEYTLYTCAHKVGDGIVEYRTFKDNFCRSYKEGHPMVQPENALAFQKFMKMYVWDDIIDGNRITYKEKETL